MHIGWETGLILGAVAASTAVVFVYLWLIQYQLEGDISAARGASNIAFSQFERRFENVLELVQMQINEEEATRSRCHIIEERCLTMLSEMRQLSLQSAQLERDLSAIADRLAWVSENVSNIAVKVDA